MALTAVNNSDGHEDTSPAADGTHEISSDGEEAEDSTAEGSGGGYNTLEFFVHASLTVTGHDLPTEFNAMTSGTLLLIRTIC